MSRANYRPDIDGLRALAVTAVVGYHAFPDIIRGGYVGVDIFFVISGFLIAGIIKAELEAGTFSFAAFYARRVRRIFPALALVLAAVLAMGWLALFNEEYKNLGAQVFAGGFFGANILFWRQSGYFDIDSAAKPLLHLWSLSVEEQFYAFLPFFLFIFRPKRRLTVTLIGLILVISFAFNLAWYGEYRPAAFYSPLTRFWELMLGVIAAVAPARAGEALGRGLEPPLATWAAAGGLALIMAAVLISPTNPHYPGWRALAPTLGALLIILAGPEGVINRALLGNRPAVALGLISYPLYLWHWPILSFLRIINGQLPSLAIRLAAVGAALTLAWLTSRFVEQPIRFGRRLGWLRTLAPIAAVLVMALGGLCLWKGDLPNRSAIAAYQAGSRQEKWALALSPFINDYDAEAGQKYAGENLDCNSWFTCLYKDAGSHETTLLLGDSHVYSAFSGVARINKKNTLALARQHIERPIPGIEAIVPKDSLEGWRRNTAAIYEFISGRPDITEVFIITRGHIYRSDAPSYDMDAFKSSLQSAINRLRTAGKKVFVLEENPAFSDVRENISFYDFMDRPLKWRPVRPQPLLTKAEFLDSRKQYLKILRELGNTTVIKGSDFFCPNEECLFSLDGVPLYQDGDHLNPYGGHLLAEKVLSPYILLKTR